MNVTLVSINSTTFKINSDAEITAELYKLSITGTWTKIDDIALLADDNDVIISDAGFYKLVDSAAPTVGAITFMQYNDVLEHLKTDVKELLTNPVLSSLSPTGYDLVTLTLLSTLILGDTTYQGESYNNSLSTTSYLRYAKAIDQCSKYLDNSANTPQSTLRQWT